MAPSKQCVARLQKELKLLRESPDAHYAAAPDTRDILTWVFVFDGPADTPYEGGRYVGKIVFPPEYPFKPPELQLHTPSGRLQVNTPICMSNSSFHPESWSPMWSVSTILTGFISFFASEETGLTCITSTPAHRRELASQSLHFNTTVLRKTYQATLPDAYDKDLQRLAEQVNGADRSPLPVSTDGQASALPSGTVSPPEGGATAEQCETHRSCSCGGGTLVLTVGLLVLVLAALVAVLPTHLWA